MFHQQLFELKIVQTDKELYELLSILSRARFIFFDTETSGTRVRHKGNDYVVGFTFAVEDQLDERVFYIPVAHMFEGEYTSHVDLAKLKLKPSDFPNFSEKEWLGKEFHNMDLQEVVNGLKPILESHYKGNVKNKITLTEDVEVEEPEIFPIKTAHNIPFDMHVLANDDIDIDAFCKYDTIDDTMYMGHTRWEEEEKKLEKHVERCYGFIKTDYDDVVATVSNDEKKSLGMKANQKSIFPHVQIPIGAQYSAEDVWFMKQLYPEFKRELIEDEMYAYYREKRVPNIKVLWDMERIGAKFDKESAKEMQKIAEKEMEKLTYKIYELVGMEFNIGSKQHLYELFHGHKKLLLDKKTGMYKESYNEKLVAKSYNFPVDHWTTGGKEKDKKLKTPKMDKEAFDDILAKEYKDKRKREGQEVVRLIKKYNKLQKLYSTYMVGMFDECYQDEKIHPSFNGCGTDSFRISCSNPNLLNLPRPLEKVKPIHREEYETEDAWKTAKKIYDEEKETFDYWIRFEIRSLIIPDDDDYVIVAADFSALEKRITAYMSKDPALQRLFAENLDPHSMTATFVFPEELEGVPISKVKKLRPDLRQRGKQVGFSMDYGGTEFAVSKSLKCPKEEARKYIDNYWKGYAVQAEHNSEMKRFGYKHGYVLTILNHKRHVEKMRTENGAIRGYYERICMNSPVQGSGADIITNSQLGLSKDAIFRAIGAKMIIQVYDEIVTVVKRKYAMIAMERMIYHMEHALPEKINMCPPLKAEADLGNTYAEAK